MGAMASQSTSVLIVCSTICGWRSKKTSKLHVTDQWPVDSPHQGPVTRKMFPFDDVIMHYIKCGGSVFCYQNLACTENVSIWWRHHEDYVWGVGVDFPHWYVFQRYGWKLQWVVSVVKCGGKAIVARWEVCLMSQTINVLLKDSDSLHVAIATQCFAYLRYE